MTRKESDLSCLETRFESKTSRNGIQHGPWIQASYHRLVKTNVFL